MRRKSISLYKEILDLSKKYIARKNVECIYLLSYEQDKRDIYDFIIVSSDLDKDMLREISEYNLVNRTKTKIMDFGAELKIVSDAPNSYSIMPFTFSEIDKTRLIKSSTIIYDKDGHYSQVAREETIGKFKNSFKYPLRKKLLLEINEDKQ